jgi:hypothetical protein
MDKIGRWKLADELTVYQVALLIAGYDPSEFEAEEPHRWPRKVTQDISPFLSAVKNAARTERITFRPAYVEGYNGASELDWASSTVDVYSLCDWLRPEIMSMVSLLAVQMR